MPQDQEPRIESAGHTMTRRPGGALRAFALGTLCVSGLALAFSLGRHWPLVRPAPKPEAASSLEEVRRRGAIPFSQLSVDRGVAEIPPTPAETGPQVSKTIHPSTKPGDTRP